MNTTNFTKTKGLVFKLSILLFLLLSFNIIAMAGPDYKAPPDQLTLACRNLVFSDANAIKPDIGNRHLRSWLRNISARADTLINGSVKNDSGEPLIGVTVRAKGGSAGAVTDNKGNFRITVPVKNTVLQFTYVGYQPLEVKVAGRKKFNIQLQNAAQNLQQMVVIGYGTVEKKNLTGSVASVKGGDLQNIPATGVNQILGGRAAGVEVTNTSGAPGASSIIRIRGGNSIQGNNNPLYVVDGVIVGQDFDLNQLNISDIKSIDVLKDATAVAIYGTRGANGVVLITTKTGTGLKAGSSEVAVNTYGGIQTFINNVHFLNGLQQAAYSNEDATFRQASLPFSDPKNVPNTDWLKLLTHNAPVYDADVSVSGLSQNGKLNYYISGGYFNQQGIVKNSGFYKYNLTSNIDLRLSDYVKVGLRLHISRLHSNNNKVGFGNLLANGIPVRAVYDSMGDYTALNPVAGGVQQNMVAEEQLATDYTNSTNFLGSAYLQIEPIKNLIIKSTFSPVINYDKHNVYNPGELPQNKIINAGGDGMVHMGTSLNILNENTINYTTNIGSSQTLNLLGGFTWQTEHSDGVTAHGYAYFNDAPTFNNLDVGGDPTRNVIQTGYDSYQLASWLARANYSYKDKYYLTLVGRVDGSSRFATTKNKYGFFPSAALAWRLDQESFLKNLKLFDILKLKVSYGLSGSQSIDSYRSLAILDGITTVFSNTLQSGVNAGRPANPDLKWENTKELDLGLEASVFEGRLSLNVDYYNKQTEGLLLNVQIPEQTGYSSKLQNLGAIRNQGIDIGITSQNISSESFRWSTTLNLSANRNRVLDLGGVNYIDVVGPTNQGGPGGRLIVGQPAPVFVGVNYLGTWKSQKEIDDSKQLGQHIGGPHFEDTNGDGQITVDDFHVLGSPQPKFYGGIQNTLSLNNFVLDFFFQGSYGNNIFNSLTQTAFFGRPDVTKYASVLNRWTPDNPTSDIPRAGTVASLSAIPNNSQEIEGGSYLRLKSVVLTYKLPVKKLGLSGAGFKNISFFFSGENLLLFSHFTLFDPETSRYGNSNIELGFSNGEYPYSKTYTMGIKATF